MQISIDAILHCCIGYIGYILAIGYNIGLGVFGNSPLSMKKSSCSLWVILKN